MNSGQTIQQKAQNSASKAPSKAPKVSRSDKESADRERDLRHLRGLAHTLDSAIPLPGGYRIGLDGIIGVIPVVGDGVTALISSYIVIRAAQLGVSTPQLVRMMLNILLETVVGVIPVVGDVFDFAWKANERNIALAERHLPHTAPDGSAKRKLTFAAVAVVVLALLAGFALAALALKLLLGVVGALG